MPPPLNPPYPGRSLADMVRDSNDPISTAGPPLNPAPMDFNIDLLELKKLLIAQKAEN